MPPRAARPRLPRPLPAPRPLSSAQAKALLARLHFAEAKLATDYSWVAAAEGSKSSVSASNVTLFVTQRSALSNAHGAVANAAHAARSAAQATPRNCPVVASQRQAAYAAYNSGVAAYNSFGPAANAALAALSHTTADRAAVQSALNELKTFADAHPEADVNMGTETGLAFAHSPSDDKALTDAVHAAQSSVASTYADLQKVRANVATDLADLRLMLVVSLRAQAISQGRYLYMREGIGIIVRAGGMILLTRMIGPTQYGLFASPALVNIFLATVVLTGMDTVLIRRPGLSDDWFHFVFTYLLITSVVVGSGRRRLQPSGGFLARRPRGWPAPFAALCASLPINVLWAPGRAKLEREMDYKQLAWVEMSSDFSQYVVSLSLAVRSRAWASGPRSGAT